jgi:hypothetical protein
VQTFGLPKEYLCACILLPSVHLLLACSPCCFSSNPSTPLNTMATAAFDLNEEPPLEHDNGIAICSFLVHLFAIRCYLFLSIVSHIRRTIVTGFDLNLPLDEFGAVDFDYLQNHAGTPLFIPCLFVYP